MPAGPAPGDCGPPGGATPGNGVTGACPGCDWGAMVTPSGASLGMNPPGGGQGSPTICPTFVVLDRLCSRCTSCFSIVRTVTQGPRPYRSRSPMSRVLFVLRSLLRRHQVKSPSPSASTYFSPSSHCWFQLTSANTSLHCGCSIFWRTGSEGSTGAGANRALEGSSFSGRKPGSPSIMIPRSSLVIDGAQWPMRSMIPRPRSQPTFVGSKAIDSGSGAIARITWSVPATTSPAAAPTIPPPAKSTSGA